jgi:hypothetical protein
MVLLFGELWCLLVLFLNSKRYLADLPYRLCFVEVFFFQRIFYPIETLDCREEFTPYLGVKDSRDKDRIE